ncbi:MAG: hypothetical protein IKS49_07270, partial [Actinomycetaceae bacterium]|nr:hypothetical protein [Actinomycetaceae bacterium]
MPTEIDIEKIVRQRLGKKARWIPGFVFGWLRKLIHEEFLNVYIRKGYVGVDFCEHCLEYLNATLKVEGLEQLDLNPERPY